MDDNFVIQGLVERLGANLDGTDFAEPDILLRVRGLLALEWMAQSNIEAYHARVMDMICAYIRENSPCSESDTGEILPAEPQPDGLPSGRMDIQFAIDILVCRTLEQIDGERQRKTFYLNLDRADLTDFDFVRRNREANFSKASFRNCSLVRAVFGGANLSRANLEGANLTEADLTEANLEGAKLAGAILRGADLTEANLEKAKLAWTDLEEAHLTLANLTGTDLTEANLEGAKLVGAHLAGAHLTGSDLTKANLERADLGRANLRGANLERADLTAAVLSEAHLAGADLEGANLMETDLRGATVTGAQFEDASLEFSTPEESVILEYVEKDECIPFEEDPD